jgi:hypothetical protein
MRKFVAANLVYYEGFISIFTEFLILSSCFKGRLIHGRATLQIKVLRNIGIRSPNAKRGKHLPKSRKCLLEPWKNFLIPAKHFCIRGVLNLILAFRSKPI